jgi:hypothetical protein
LTATTRQLTDTTDGDCLWPKISGDGSYVYFGSTSGYFGPKDHGPFRLEVATGAVERAGALRGGFTTPGWRRDAGVSVDATGGRAVYGDLGDWTDENADENFEVWLVDYVRQARIYVSKESPTLVTWDAEPRARRYDVIRGDVANLAMNGESIDLGAVECIEDDSPDTTTERFEDQDDPAVGQVFFYLYRGSQGILDGPGSYGTGSGESERTAGSGDCGT